MGVTFLAISSVAFTQELSSEHLWIQSKRGQKKEVPKVASVANCIIGQKSVSIGQGEKGCWEADWSTQLPQMINKLEKMRVRRSAPNNQLLLGPLHGGVI